MSDDDQTTEEMMQTAAQGAANFMRGAALDPRLPADIRQALRGKADEVDKAIEAAYGF